MPLPASSRSRASSSGVQTKCLRFMTLIAMPIRDRRSLRRVLGLVTFYVL
jgi:hypothetical protein